MGAALNLLATAAAVAGAAYMLVAPCCRSGSCETTPGSGVQGCTAESSETLLENEHDARVFTFAAVPVLLTAGTTLLAFRAPRLRIPRWLAAGVFLFLCVLSGFTIGIYFLPSALLLIFSVGLDEARASEEARASG
ncbi:MAG: hypothetical protein WD557_00150 [Dehalococcoidia bacterium]